MRFSKWLNENELPEGDAYREPATIPITREVMVLDLALRQGDSNAEVYVVGGAVRDYLYHQLHGTSGSQYQPKDIDLTTNLSEEEILQRLRRPYAVNLGIRVKEKTSVDTFGVVFASVDGGPGYEIAPFRKDIGSADGRRPERVERGTIYEDAMRRDLTINNLYYDFHRKEILDFNRDENGRPGQGVQDIRNRAVRTAGDPFQRFDEDKLRVLRLLRFFSRFNPGSIRESLDEKTLSAIEYYKDLRRWGISAERIMMEFLSGIKQSQITANYIQNFADLGLLNTVFPSLQVDINGIARVGNSKNPPVIFAWLLRKNANIASQLLRLKYPSDIAQTVEYLVNSLSVGPDSALAIVRSRDKRLIGPNAGLSREEMAAHNERITNSVKRDLFELGQISGDSGILNRLRHLSGYQVPHEELRGEELMRQGFQGPAIRDEQQRRTAAHYARSYQDFVQQTSQKDSSPIE